MYLDFESRCISVLIHRKIMVNIFNVQIKRIIILNICMIFTTFAHRIQTLKKCAPALHENQI